MTERMDSRYLQMLKARLMMGRHFENDKLEDVVLSEETSHEVMVRRYPNAW